MRMFAQNLLDQSLLRSAWVIKGRGPLKHLSYGTFLHVKRIDYCPANPQWTKLGPAAKNQGHQRTRRLGSSSQAGQKPTRASSNLAIRHRHLRSNRGRHQHTLPDPSPESTPKCFPPRTRRVSPAPERFGQHQHHHCPRLSNHLLPPLRPPPPPPGGSKTHDAQAL